MKKNSRSTMTTIILTSVIMLIISIIGLFTPTDAIKAMGSYSGTTEIKAHHFDATISDDGSMLVVENIDYSFNSVNGFIRDYQYGQNEYESMELLSVKINGKEFEKKDYAFIGDHGVYEARERCIGESRQRCTIPEIKIYQPTNGKLKAQIIYKVTGLITGYNDMQDFYWKFYDTLNDTLPSENVSVSVHFPKAIGKDNMKVFAHGDLDGEVKIENDSLVTVDVPFFGENTFGEVRVLLPSKPISNTVGWNKDENAYDQVLTQELKDAEETNEKIATNKKAQEQKQKVGFLTSIIQAIAAITTAILGFIGYKKIYKAFDKEKYEFNFEYYREVATDYGPAIAALVADPEKKVDQSQLTASLFNLYIKKQIEIDLVKEISKRGKEEEKVYITLNPRTSAILTDDESYLYTWLQDFDKDSNRFSYDSFMLNDGKKNTKNSEVFLTKYNSFLSKVTLGYNRLGYQEYPGRKKAIKTGLNWVMLVLAIVMAINFMFDGLLVPMSLVGIVFIMTLLIQGTLSKYRHDAYRYTEKGAEEHAKMKGLKKYLEDYSMLNEANPSLVNLWEKYFVYGLSLGVTEKALKDLYNKLPTDQTAMAQTTYRRYYTMNRMMTYHHINAYNASAISSVTSTVQAARVAANVSRSSGRSSFGGGGGFSGGGGFGGGGGGGRSF